MSEQTEHNKKAILVALEKSLGVVTAACKQVGIGRTQFYEWVKNDPEFAAKVDEIREVTLDFAESSLYQQIKKGNTAATIFLLKTKGKGRGYIERQEFDLGTDNHFRVEVNLGNEEDTD